MNKQLEILLTILVLVFVACKPSSNETPLEEVNSIDEAFCTMCPTLESGEDTFRFVIEVRQFVAKHAKVGLINNSNFDSYSNLPIESLPVDSLIELFNAGRARCTYSMASKIMVHILLRNGIPAYKYKFGFEEEGVTAHVVLFENAGKLYVSDPYLNYDLADYNGEPLELQDVINEIGKGKSNLNFSTDTVGSFFLIDHSLQHPAVQSLSKRIECKNLLAQRQIVRDSIVEYPIYKCFKCDEDRACFSFINRFEETLRSKTQLTNFLEALVLKSGPVEGAKNQQEIDDLIETAIYSQPNLGKRVRKPTK